MALPARPVWTGQIRLALVALPVKLYSALDSREKISFNQIHEPSKQRIKYEKVVPGIGPVDKDDIVKGYEVQKGRYVLFSDEEFEALKIDSKKTLDMIQFAPAESIDPIYFDKPYYALPDGKLADEPYRVVRDALRRTGTIGLGQITMRGRSYIAAVKPYEDGILVETVHYAEELRAAKGFFDEIPAGKSEPDLVDLAEELIKRKQAPFDPKKIRGRIQPGAGAADQEKNRARRRDHPGRPGIRRARLWRQRRFTRGRAEEVAGEKTNDHRRPNDHRRQS